MALHGTQHTAGHVGCQETCVRGWSSVPWGVGGSGCSPARCYLGGSGEGDLRSLQPSLHLLVP